MKQTPTTRRIVTVVGARPQLIKAAAISRQFARRADAEEILVHTGQHYDDALSGVFFRELGIPEPRYNLGIGGLPHGALTGRMLEGLEKVLVEEKPDWVLLYGDTNSTLAGALAAVKLHIPCAHVEAGLRSFNMQMPEEVNRIVADRFARLLFCPTEAARAQLAREGITEGIHVVGDVMYDMVMFARERAASVDLAALGIPRGGHVVLTLHRQENTDDPDRLDAILTAMARIAVEVPVVLPLHPRTRHVIEARGWSERLSCLRVIDPLPYLAMNAAIMTAQAVITDSGGLQKEAFFHRVPTLTLRDETEWVETVELGWNLLCGADADAIWAGWRRLPELARDFDRQPYGDGHAAEKIVDLLLGAG